MVTWRDPTISTRTSAVRTSTVAVCPAIGLTTFCLCLQPSAVCAYPTVLTMAVGDEVARLPPAATATAPSKVPRLDERANPIAVTGRRLCDGGEVGLHRGHHRAVGPAVRAHRPRQLRVLAERLRHGETATPRRTACALPRLPACPRTSRSAARRRSPSCWRWPGRRRSPAGR